MTKLSKRLECLVHFVEENENYIDIGCDHGLLDIALAKKYQGAKIIASDINENALNNARKNIKKCHLEDRIETVQSDGLKEITPAKATTVIISGMGAHTIVGILNQSDLKLKNVSTLVIQSNNDLDFLRKKVTHLGYYIQKEALVMDAHIIYTIIVFRKGYRFYTTKQLYLGPCLQKENSFLFQKKIKQDLEKMYSFYPNIPRCHFRYRNKIRRKIKYLSKTLTKSDENFNR